MKASKRVLNESLVLKLLVSYDSSGNIEYIGTAPPGTGRSEANWNIVRISYDSSGNFLERLHGNGTVNFTCKWSLRQIYDYM